MITFIAEEVRDAGTTWEDEIVVTECSGLAEEELVEAAPQFPPPRPTRNRR